ncbi:hypothetical protein SDC9_93025 [bioreactor metagenome]|uniref:N-acetyltransferase domain-containing protein n=1 Tax=bioreactor metagenome TaxID=1076179 RepID=A0A644ZZW4_9ZZZZ|nr:GNAT family N-acetyltransferase [Erysipelotrichaceae bacterium]
MKNTSMVVALDLSDSFLAEEVLIIQKAAYQVEAELIDYPGIPALFETKEALMSSKESFIGYYDGDQLNGVLAYELINDCLIINRLIVNPLSFRQGIGTQLLTYLDRHNPNHHAFRVSTGKLNEPALRLYQKCGFVIIKDFLINDVLWMTMLEKKGCDDNRI